MRAATESRAACARRVKVVNLKYLYIVLVLAMEYAVLEESWTWDEGPPDAVLWEPLGWTQTARVARSHEVIYLKLSPHHGYRPFRRTVEAEDSNFRWKIFRHGAGERVMVRCAGPPVYISVHAECQDGVIVLHACMCKADFACVRIYRDVGCMVLASLPAGFRGARASRGRRSCVRPWGWRTRCQYGCCSMC